MKTTIWTVHQRWVVLRRNDSIEKFIKRFKKRGQRRSDVHRMSAEQTYKRAVKLTTRSLGIGNAV